MQCNNTQGFNTYQQMVVWEVYFDTAWKIAFSVFGFHYSISVPHLT